MELTLNPKSFGTFIRIHQFFFSKFEKKTIRRKLQRNHWIDWRSGDCLLCILSSNWIIYQMKIENYNVSLITFWLFPFGDAQRTYERATKEGNGTDIFRLENDTTMENELKSIHTMIINKWHRYLLSMSKREPRTLSLWLTKNHQHFIIHFADTFKVQFCQRVPILLVRS